MKKRKLTKTNKTNDHAKEKQKTQKKTPKQKIKKHKNSIKHFLRCIQNKDTL